MTGPNSKKTTTVADVNPFVLDAKYAVRGPILQKALELAADKTREDPVVFMNVGNPQKVGGCPLTFPRQVLACVECPELIKASVFPAEVTERASSIIDGIGGKIGAYSHSQGFQCVREEVVKFISDRDGGHTMDVADIFLGNGASAGITNVLKLLLRPGTNDSAMIPMPQYPLYSATISLLGSTPSPYFLDEETGWGLTVEALEEAHAAAVARGENPRVLTVINPGNPTGKALSEAQVSGVVSWCEEKNIVILADEVYQENIYAGSEPFVAFHKVVRDMKSDMELFSFHSLSKGFFGECGHRGGYTHLTNIDSGLAAQLYKLASVNLCPNTAGQVLVGLMCNPPAPTGECGILYQKEKDSILSALNRKSKTLAAAFSRLPGITCQEPTAAMYAFPKVNIPKAAVKAAEKQGVAPDFFYCMELLCSTGICVVPGCGFGQKDGTYHFRTTFLPAEDVIDAVVKKFEAFHLDFLARYGSEETA